MKLKFLTKLLVGVLIVCGVMFFVGCSDDDKDDNKADYGKSGEIPGVYVHSYQDTDEGGTYTITHTLTLNKPSFGTQDNGGGTGTISYYAPNTGNNDISWNRGSNFFEICYKEDSGTSCSRATFDGADAITWDGYNFTRKK